jgi:hypothetical protein
MELEELSEAEREDLAGWDEPSCHDPAPDWVDAYEV